MRRHLKNIGLILVFISSLIYLSCHPEEVFSDKPTAGREIEFNGEICDGKKILSFASLAELHQEHFNLYQQYEAGNQEEQILVDYENNHNFYSLRKKEQDMDDGIIPDDPTFDETEFTFDPILETLLNEDGMIIIDGWLYVWDSGCVIQSIPFSCSNYENLLTFYNAAKTNSTDLMHHIFISKGMKNTNTCDNANFDLESISENGGRVIINKPRMKNKNGCGYDVVLNSQLMSCDGEWNTYKVSFESIEPLNASNPLNAFFITSAFGDLAGLEFGTNLGSFGSIPLTNEDETYGYVVPYFDTFYVRIPAGDINIFSISLTSTINLFSGNSCMSSDTVAIDNNCPFSIVAVKNNVSSSQATWTFSIPSTNDCPIGGSKVTWNFGDGTTITAGFTVTHTYTVPCKMQYLTVTAIVDGPVCGTTNKLFTKSNIPNGNPCMREAYKFPTHKGTLNGKKYKVDARIKRTASNKAVCKNKFKCRILQNKTIKSIGSIYSPTANNGSCMQGDISTVVPPKTTDGKKRNRQRVSSTVSYYIDAMNPYKVHFTHSNGFSYLLTADDLYCSQ